MTIKNLHPRDHTIDLPTRDQLAAIAQQISDATDAIELLATLFETNNLQTLPDTCIPGALRAISHTMTDGLTKLKALNQDPQ